MKILLTFDDGSRIKTKKEKPYSNWVIIFVIFFYSFIVFLLFKNTSVFITAKVACLS